MRDDAKGNGPKVRQFRDTAQDEAAQYTRLAERYAKDGQPVMATLMRNAAWIAGGGDMSEYEWAERFARKDGRTDDITVTRR